MMNMRLNRGELDKGNYIVLISIDYMQVFLRTLEFAPQWHYSFSPCSMVISFVCNHSCPGVERQRRGCQTVPSAPPTTTNPPISHCHAAFTQAACCSPLVCLLKTHFWLLINSTDTMLCDFIVFTL